MKKVTTLWLCLILGVSLGLLGCGKDTKVTQTPDSTKQTITVGKPDEKKENSSTSDTSSTRQLSPEAKQEQASIRSLDTKTTQGKKTVDTKIDEKLKTLDSTLDTLEKSMSVMGELDF